MRSILLVYYSLNGTTRRIAHEIATRCDCDIEEIRDARRRVGWLGLLQSAYKSRVPHSVALEPMRSEPIRYDMIVIGTPLWLGREAAPVRSYIERERSAFNRVALFCTHDRKGGERAIARMAAACGKTPVATLVAGGTHRAEAAVADFANTLCRCSDVPARGRPHSGWPVALSASLWEGLKRTGTDR